MASVVRVGGGGVVVPSLEDLKGSDQLDNCLPANQTNGSGECGVFEIIPPKPIHN